MAVEDVCDVGPLPHRESRVRHRLVHTLAVLFLRPRERLATVRERDDGPGLVRERDRRLEGAVSTAHDQHVPSPVLCRIDQAIHHPGIVFTGDTKLARGPPPADREQHSPGLVGGRGRLDLEAVVVSDDRLHSLSIVDLEPGSLLHLPPERQKLFLRSLA